MSPQRIHAGNHPHRFAMNDTDSFFEMFTSSSGVTEMKVSGTAVTPIAFFVSPSTAESPRGVDIARINIKLTDTGLRWTFFGGLGALTNGVKIEHLSTAGAVLFDFTDGHPMKINADWSLLAGTDDMIHPAAGPDAIPIRWTLAKAGSAFHLNQGQSLRISVQDDLTGLTTFEAMAQGVYEE